MSICRSAAVLSLIATAAVAPVGARAQAAHDDSVRIVNVTPKSGPSLPAILKSEAAAALSAGRTPFVELGATWCGPCRKLAASLGPLGDSRMIDAFAGTSVIHVDVDDWKGTLDSLGFKSDGIPAFFRVDSLGKPTGPVITGAAWGEDIPENMAPPLKKFFQEHLEKKK